MESDDLFTHASQNNSQLPPPLAFAMRPKNLEEVVGQKHILSPGKPLRRWIEKDQVPSLLFWGPPGTGKTTLATLVAQSTKSHFIMLSAVLGGVKEIREAVDQAKAQRMSYSKKTFVFVDEIHRFNKTQQDALLPHVESGLITLIGATTENPSFSVCSALLSRLRVLKLERVGVDQICIALKRAQKHSLQKLDDKALFWLSEVADGDVRRALTLLETVRLYYMDDSSAASPNLIELQDVMRALEGGLNKKVIRYDQKGEQHYSLISAFIKSMRASQKEAAVYYLARMIEGGEDPLFICRRLIIFASEDIGPADPSALQMAVSAHQALERIGMPEGQIVLSQLTLHLSLAPKSRAAYDQILEALARVQATGSLPVPGFLLTKPTQTRLEGQSYFPEGAI